MRLFLVLSLLVFSFINNNAQAFCGFYVAKADTSLFNRASKVVIMRNEDKTVITMANDYKGDLTEFAMVIPVPQILNEKQINITENSIIDHLDAYTSPRLVEYFDEDPCMMRRMESMMLSTAMDKSASNIQNEKLGIKIEAEYTIGEYDIIILSAKESDGLQKWLIANEYKIPQGAENILNSYIKQGMKFFVAKVNLEEQSKTGNKFLRPLQVAFESEKFMLPIRLGTINAEADQELFIFTLTKNGRVESSNYRTVKIPSNNNIPLYVKDKFNDFYTSLFTKSVEQENKKAIMLEYAWDMNWCDPCAADPLSNDQLRQLGVFWLDNAEDDDIIISPRRMPKPMAKNVFVTRMHLRYNAESFPEDLKFIETNNRQNFQGRYVLNHPYKGEAKCEIAENYFKKLPKRFEKEAQELASLTNWDINEIRSQMAENGQKYVVPEKSEEKKWYELIWQ